MPSKNKSIADLIAISKPQDWKDWLFQLQSVLLADGYFEELTETGRNYHAARMQGLYNFFGQQQEKNKS